MSTPPRQRRSAPRPAPLLRRLQHEWTHISIGHDELRRASAWQLAGAPLASLDDLLERCGHAPGRGAALRTNPLAELDDADRQLLALVALARDDVLAGRIVLQRILPPLCAIARRHATAQPGREELFGHLVANAWPIIGHYPVERRPRRVAANLVRDVAFHTLVRPARRRSADEVIADFTSSEGGSWSGHLTTQDEPPDPAAELDEVLDGALAARWVTSDDVGLVKQLLLPGGVATLAAERSVTPRTIRNHRDAVIHRLRRYAETAA